MFENRISVVKNQREIAKIVSIFSNWFVCSNAAPHFRHHRRFSCLLFGIGIARPSILSQLFFLTCSNFCCNSGVQSKLLESLSCRYNDFKIGLRLKLFLACTCGHRNEFVYFVCVSGY